MNQWNFFREALRSFRSTGAIASASPALVRRLVEDIPGHRPLRVVELGPGNGCVTHALLERLSPDSELTAFEINPVFTERLRAIPDPRLRVIGEGAERLPDYFEDNSVDFVVSSLPLSMISKEVKTEIIARSQRALRSDGHFLQYQYALQDYGLLKDYFPAVRLGFTLVNLPPAFVYTCSLGLV